MKHYFRPLSFPKVKMDVAPSNYVDCAWVGGGYAGGLSGDYFFMVSYNPLPRSRIPPTCRWWIYPSTGLMTRPPEHAVAGAWFRISDVSSAFSTVRKIHFTAPTHRNKDTGCLGWWLCTPILTTVAKTFSVTRLKMSH